MTQFGELLKKHRTLAKYEDGTALSQEKFAELIDPGENSAITNITISRWENGARTIKVGDRDRLMAIVRVLAEFKGLLTIDEANTLLQSGGYAALTASEIAEINLPENGVNSAESRPTQIEDHSNEINGDVINNIDQSVYNGPVTKNGDIHIHNQVILNPARLAKEWFSRALKLDEANEHMRTSSAGMSLYIFRVLTEYITAQVAFGVVLAIILWVLADYFLTPLWTWPFNSDEELLNACLKFSIGSFLIPPLIAATTPQEAHTRLTPSNKNEWRLLIVLKLTGAYMGFFIFAILPLAVVMAKFYLTGTSLPRFVLVGAAFFPIFFSHVVARRHIVNHFAWAKQEWRFMKMDQVIFAIFLFMGSLVGFLLYIAYDLFSQPLFGMLILLVLLGMILWESRGKLLPQSKDWHVIALVGLGISVVGALVTVFGGYFGDFRAFSAETYALIALVYSYAITIICLWLTTIKRQTSRLSLQGLIALLLILLGVQWVAERMQFDARIAVFGLAIIWVLLNRHIEGWLYLHPSFWVYFAAVGLSLWAETRGSINVWGNFLLFSAIGFLLNYWAYNSTKTFNPVLRMHRHIEAQ